MLELVRLPLLRQFLLAQGLAGDPAENGAEGPADRGADDGGCDARYLPEKRCCALREAAYAAKGPAKELITFQLAGQLVLLELLCKLVLFPLVLLAFMLLELTEAADSSSSSSSLSYAMAVHLLDVRTSPHHHPEKRSRASRAFVEGINALAGSASHKLGIATATKSQYNLWP